MRSLTSRLRRLAAVDRQLAPEPQPVLSEYQQQRHEEWKKAFTRLFCCFPPKLYSRFLNRIKTMDNTSDCLQDLINGLTHESWKAQPIPLDIAEIYLDDPMAKPWLRCTQCHLPLPHREAYWHNTQSGEWWKAPRYYITQCPVCSGNVIHSYYKVTLKTLDGLPFHPEHPWEVHDRGPYLIGSLALTAVQLKLN